MAQITVKKQPKQDITGGDDLDDGLELDPDLLASSDHEDDDNSDHDADIGDEETKPDNEYDEEDEEPDVDVGEKRKRDTVEDMDEEERKADKKRRQKEKHKERKANKAQNMPGLSTFIPATHLKPAEFTTLLLNSIRETFPAITPMEIDDLQIPEDRLLAAAQFPAPENTPEAIMGAMKRRIDGLVKSGKVHANGTPRVIVLCLSGIRCADVVRDVRSVKGNGEVAKLFAKHMKVHEQVKLLQMTKTTIAVGTPARVAKLITEDALIINKDTMILLDIGHRDSKTSTLLTLREVRNELWKSIFSGEVRKRIMDAGAHIGAV